MADLLYAVQWYGRNFGYASRYDVIPPLRRSATARLGDDEVRRLIAEALSEDWISEVPGGAKGPGYVLTRRGDAYLQLCYRGWAA